MTDLYEQFRADPDATVRALTQLNQDDHDELLYLVWNLWTETRRADGAGGGTPTWAVRGLTNFVDDIIVRECEARERAMEGV